MKLAKFSALINVIDKKVLGYICAFMCVLMWSFIPVVSRFGQLHLDNFQFLFWSNILSLVVVFVCMIAIKGAKAFRNFSMRKITYVLFLGALGCAAYYLCLYYGYAQGNSIEVLILQYSWPLLIIILSVVILNERLSRKSWAAVAVGFFGIIVVLTKGDVHNIQFSSLDVSLIVLMGALCFALFSVLGKKLNAEPFAVTTLLFVGGSIVSVISLCMFSSFQLPSKGELVPVVLNGALINGTSYILWLMALERISGSIAAIIVFITPVLSAIWIVIFFEDIFYPAYGIGFILVLTAGFLCIKYSNDAAKG